jgi:hypothetical protein
VDEELEDINLDVLEDHAVVGFLPTSVVGYAKVLRVVANEVFVYVEDGSSSGRW